MQPTCYQCKRNISSIYEKYQYLKARGYNEKDAAVNALKNFNSEQMPKSCCVVNVITNRPLTGGTEQYRQNQEKVKAAYEEIVKIRGGNIPRRTKVKLFVRNDAGNINGKFVLLNSPTNDINSILGRYDERTRKMTRTGLNITNFDLFPNKLLNSYGWSGQEKLIIWSGDIYIVPIVTDEETNREILGNIWIYEEGIEQPFKLESVKKGAESIDKEKQLLDSELVEYEVTKQIQNGITTDVGVLTVLKVLPSENIHI